MTDYTELQKSAEYAAQDTIKFADESEEMRALQQFHEEVSPETVLALIAESDSARKHWQNESNNVQVLVAEVARLKAENELARMRIKELDLLFGRYILAMRAALIEEEHGKGAAAAMEWIYNSLAGPGELPPESETDSQAYFDREIVAVDDGMQEVMAFHEGRRAAIGEGEQS